MIKTKHYANVHAFINRKFGKASKCENEHCTFEKPKRFEWALRNGREYSKNPDDYMQLCVSCHRKYDFTETKRERMSASQTGKKKIDFQGKGHFRSKPITQFDLDGNIVREWESINRCSVETGLYKQSILNCLSGKMHQTKGSTFKWYNTQHENKKV